MGAAPQVTRGPGAYQLDDRFHDEAYDAAGRPRAAYEPVLSALAGADLSALAKAVDADVRKMEVSFGTSPFHVDPVPRIFERSEWDLVERGLAQRVRALRAFTADVYGDRRIVADGIVPARAIDGAEHFEPWMLGVEVPDWAYMSMAGIDLVRGAHGRLAVLEDNLRTPSGLTYAVAARDACRPHLPCEPPKHLRPLDGVYETLGAALRSAVPGGDGEPLVVLLSDGPSNSAWYEHRVLARRLGVPLVTPDDLYPSRGRLRAMLDGGSRDVDVIYRRTDEDRLLERDGRATWVAEVLLDPCRAGRLSCVNAFGGGVADDKLIHGYVDAMVRFYLREEPLIRSVPTYDLGVESTRESVLARLDEVVVKPRAGHGGHGIVVGPHATPEDREVAARRVRAEPEAWVAQETVMLSRHPTVDGDGVLAPRHVDLRAFVVSSEDEVSVPPSGLTRFGRDPGALVVNSSQDGGGKDTWVIA